jgi:Zn-dependent peptidase ImmA (M78 family)
VYAEEDSAGTGGIAAVRRSTFERNVSRRHRLEAAMTSEIKTEAAREAARLLTAAWPFGVPVDPVSIARTAGLRVLEAPLDEDTLGALIKQPGQEPTIMINQGDPENRKRFTCAHELGHWVRRSKEADEYTTVDLRSGLSTTGDDPEEVFANEFAACLLMPEDTVRALHAGDHNDIEMAIELKVSREAMQFRLKNLGLMA